MNPFSDAECRGLVFLHYHDREFCNGLIQHGISVGEGYRIVSERFSDLPFSACFPAIRELLEQPAPFHVDRILGGAPFLDLDGIEAISGLTRKHPHFLGFQMHEWEHSPLMDMIRIDKLFTQAAIPFDEKNFRSYRNRRTAPFFSGGNEEIYRQLPRDLTSMGALMEFYTGYYSHFAQRTGGELMSVNGNYQLHHLAARLGARSVVAEIGNQVALSALQIAVTRGAATEFGVPFGVYYEPWGGQPTSCTSALHWSAWFGKGVDLTSCDQGLGLPMGNDLGSSRALQRRLIYFSWLAGAAFLSEEWGPENYFGNWVDYPLTRYGEIMAEIDHLARRYPRPQPVVPVALLLPPGVPGIDHRFLASGSEAFPLFKFQKADDFHCRLQRFATELLGACAPEQGAEAFNLTSSPWIGAFDVLSSEATPEQLAAYDLVVSFDEAQVPTVPHHLLYHGTKEEEALIGEVIERAWQLQIHGRVGATIAHVGKRRWLGLFNNLGVSKKGTDETTDPDAAQDVVVKGNFPNCEIVVGSAFIRNAAMDRIEMVLPPGEVVVLSYDWAE